MKRIADGVLIGDHKDHDHYLVFSVGLDVDSAASALSLVDGWWLCEALAFGEGMSIPAAGMCAFEVKVNDTGRILKINISLKKY